MQPLQTEKIVLFDLPHNVISPCLADNFLEKNFMLCFGFAILNAPGHKNLQAKEI